MPTSTVAPLRFISDALFRRALDADGDEHPVRLAAAGERRDPLADSSPFALIVSVAPNWRAAASLAASTSTAMMGRRRRGAPLDGVEADAAAADDDDARAGFTPAVLTTAPSPVSTPQAMRAALSSGDVLRDRDRLRLVDNHLLGEGAGAQAVDARLAGASASGVKRSSGNTSSQKTARLRRKRDRSRNCG